MRAETAVVVLKIVLVIWGFIGIATWISIITQFWDGNLGWWILKALISIIPFGITWALLSNAFMKPMFAASVALFMSEQERERFR